MRRYCYLIILTLFLPLFATAQEFQRLQLPNLEQMSSERVLYMMQDSEGCLWYATEGGGICRDDGRQIEVFRNNSDHPDMLGSNNVGCLAEAGKNIIIGTFHGAYVLSKDDFSIRRLTEVDDKRVDDILVTRKGDIFLTANMKIYKFSSSLQHLATYPSKWKGRDTYVAHIFEDLKGNIWATQWSGGLVRLKGGKFDEMPWNIDALPSDMADDNATGCLWIGTLGKGIVRYHTESGDIDLQPQTGNVSCIDIQPSADGKRLWMIGMNSLSLFQNGDQLTAVPIDNIVPEEQMVLHRLSLDLNDRLLVSGSMPGPFVITCGQQQAWFDKSVADGNLRWEFRERQGLVLHSADGERVVSVGGQQILPIVVKRNSGGIWTTNGTTVFACTEDTTTQVAQLTVHPVAMADDTKGCLWISTGKEIHRLWLKSGKEETVLNHPDVSALAFTPDGTLWLATIYGKIFRYAQGKLTDDEYASNEYGDAVTNIVADSAGRLLISYDQYIRIYDPARKTLRQQSREPEGVYMVELQTTKPGSKWTHPQADNVVERLPQWLTSWWMWCTYIIIFTLLAMLLAYNFILRRQRKKFLEYIKTLQAEDKVEAKEPIRPEEADETSSMFLASAIEQVVAHLSDGDYNVEQLSSDLCMSRMTFYRKIQSATGQKPTEFMRTIRLRKAAEMLRGGEKNISEISFATGFSSVSYFSRCFRTMYGVPPTQFGEATTAEALSPTEIPS